MIESVKLDPKSEFAHLKVDGDMRIGNLAMRALGNLGGFEVARLEMYESTAWISRPRCVCR